MPNTSCMIYIIANITRSPGIRMQNLRKSKKTFCCFSTLLFHHVPEEQAITDDISSPHTLWLLHQSIEPFQTVLLPPDRGTLYGTSEEVEDSTDGTYVTMDVQLIPMRVRPLLLLRCRHANPEQIRVGSIDGINDSLVVLIRELRLIRRRSTTYRRVPDYQSPMPTHPVLPCDTPSRNARLCGQSGLASCLYMPHTTP